MEGGLTPPKETPESQHKPTKQQQSRREAETYMRKVPSNDVLICV